MDNGCITPLSGIPVIQTTVVRQKRTHKRSRINKKWKKRYGMIRYETQDGDIYAFDGKLFVTTKGYEGLQKIKNAQPKQSYYFPKEMK